MPTKGRKGNSPEQSFKSALKSVKKSPDSLDDWEKLEELGEDLGKHDDVAAAYLGAISKKLPPPTQGPLFESAIRYHDEWFGDDPEAMNRVLSKVLEVDPRAEWAFDRLTVVLSAAEKWDELLDAHDRMLETAKDATHRKTLLGEAANVAKDFARDPGRAAKYMLMQLEMDMSNGSLATSAQRLLERTKNWKELIGLWKKRIGVVKAKKARSLRIQIAQCYLEHLDDSEQALLELGQLLDEHPGDLEVCRVTEQILVSESASDEVKLAALARLTANYDSANESEAAIDAIKTVIDQVSDEQTTPLHRNAGLRLATLGKDVEAIEQYTALLIATPTDLEARKQLRHLANRSKQHGLFAHALNRASVDCEETSLRVALLAEAANIYWNDLSDTETAIDLFNRILLTPDVDQASALSAAHCLNELQNTEDTQKERLEVLERLATLERSREVRKAVQGEAARLASTLGDDDKALTFWQARLESESSDLEAMNAIIDLLAKKEDWPNLVAALLQRAQADVLPAQRRVDSVRIATIQHEHLGNTNLAIETWLRILSEFGPDTDLLQNLEYLMASVGRFAELAETLEKAISGNNMFTASRLSRLGDIHFSELGNSKKAGIFYILAIRVDAGDERARVGLRKLGDSDEYVRSVVEPLAEAYTSTGDFQLLIELLEPRLSGAKDDLQRVRILEETAELQSQRTGDEQGALETLARAFLLTPESVRIEQKILRLAEHTGNWTVPAQTFVMGAEAIAFEAVRSANLRLKAADILAEKMNDGPAAVDVVKSILEGDGGNLTALKRLADLEGTQGSDSLVDTLVRIDGLVDDLDPLRRACELALEKNLEYRQVRKFLVKLFEKSSRFWENGVVMAGTQTPEANTAWALNRIRELDTEAKREEKTVPTLLRAANLPFSAEISRDLRLLAARVLADSGNRGSAIDLYRSESPKDPKNADIIHNLAALLRLEGRNIELAAILKHSLALTDDLEKILETRLEINDLLGEVQGENERFKTIAANLTDSPGHPASMAGLNRLLMERVSYEDAVELLTNQAEILEQRNENPAAAKIWTMVARLRLSQFSDSEGASEAYARVVQLHCSNDALDALSELAVKRGAHREGAKWLEKRLADTTEIEDRIPIMLKLAKSLLQADEQEKAVSTLELAFQAAPEVSEVRRLLVMQYRASEKWEELVETLTQATAHIEDTNTVASYVREVLDICRVRLERPELAVPILEHATQLFTDNREFKLALAEGLRRSDRLEEAQTWVEQVISEWGRRRSPQRAQAHLLLARISSDQEDEERALSELQTASTMDSQNDEIWQMLAETARKADELEKAERAYRTLLIIIRRDSGESTEGPRISQSEVFVELAWIAKMRGQNDQADELCESAFEILKTGEAEMKRFVEKLLEWDRPDLIERAFEVRLSRVAKPRHRGAILSEFADLLEGRLDRPDDAFEARMKALDSDPGQPALHDALYRKAVESDQLDLYFEKLNALLESTQRGADVHSRCEILLRLTAIMEQDRDDLEAAKGFYLEAEATGVREVDVWKAGIRVATALEDESEQARLLTNLSNLGEDVEAETRADVYYRLAEIQMASEDTLNEGVLSMENALEENPRFARAARILRRVCETHPQEENVIGLYERVARKTEDPNVLLDALERRSLCENATPELVREGAEAALELNETQRAEALMLRAVELSAELLEGLAHVPWALLGLARMKRDAGDLAGAVKWASEAAAVADLSELYELVDDLTSRLDESEADPKLAMRLHEKLFDRDSTAPKVWKSLAAIYTNLEETDRLERLLEEVQVHITDPAEQRALQLQQAQLALTIPSREGEGLASLKGIVAEDPSNQEAMTHLINYLEKAERLEELHELLLQQFNAVIEKNDPTRIKDAAIGFGGYLKTRDVEQAASVFRTALSLVPNDPELMADLLETIDEDGDQTERAGLLEKMIQLVSEERVPSIVLEVANIYENLSDGDGVLRVLDAGFEKAPENDEIRERLIGVYRVRGNESGLAEILIRSAENQPTEKLQASILKEAAQIYLGSLADPNAAIPLLRRVIELDPEHARNILDLARTLFEAGDAAGAREELTGLIEDGEDETLRVEALEIRSQIALKAGDLDGALLDLQSAFEIAPERVAVELKNTLQKKRSVAASSGDIAMERTVMLQLTDLMRDDESDEETMMLLENWIKKEPADNEIKRQLLALLKNAERWVDAAQICASLVATEEGDLQTEAALELAAACKEASTPELARPGLETAMAHQPQNREIRSALYGIYEQSGDYEKVAGLLLEDALELEDPDEKAEVLSRAGLLFLSTEDVENAETALTQSLELRQNDIETILALIDIHLSAEKTDNALDLIEQGIAACKDQRDDRLSSMHGRMARLAKLLNDPENEIKWLKQVVLTDRDNGQAALELVERAEELEEWDTVIWALRAIARMKNDPPLTKTQIALRQGKIALVRGDARKAALFARQALQEDPDDAETIAFLADLEKK